MKTTPDRIEKRITLRASPERVWRAISTPREFSAWFEVDLRGDFVPGATVRGPMTYKGYEHLSLEMTIERMEKERLFAFRWHPYAVEPDVDYSNEPMTLVELRLEPAAEGTLLVVTESGFDRIPADRRPRAFEMNSGGWTAQLQNIERYLDGRVVRARVHDTFARPPEEVFDAIADPRRMSQYFISSASGPMVAGKTVEWHWADYGDARSNVEVVELERGKRIAFDWYTVEHKTRVEMTLSSEDGKTKLAISETGWPLDMTGVKRALGQTEGWTNFCCCLKAYLLFGIDLRRGRAAEHVA